MKGIWKKDILKLALVLALFGSCAVNKSVSNEQIFANKGEAYTNPNQKVDVEILIQETAKSNPDSSISRGALKPGSIIPQHEHKNSDEYLIFLKGHGELTVDGETRHLKDGDVVFIPKGKTHSYVNREGRDAVFYQIYTPAGPEQRFKEWSEKK